MIYLAKLESCGISGIVNKLIKSYLNSQYQRTVIQDNINIKLSSVWELVKRSFPQNSILCPLLFLIYVNDLWRTVSKLANTILFANDTSIVISNSNQDDFKTNINSVMNEIMNLFQSNLLTLNCNKTHFYSFWQKRIKKYKFRQCPPIQ
jgi:hypothetical protein